MRFLLLAFLFTSSVCEDDSKSGSSRDGEQERDPVIRLFTSTWQLMPVAIGIIPSASAEDVFILRRDLALPRDLVVIHRRIACDGAVLGYMEGNVTIHNAVSIRCLQFDDCIVTGGVCREEDLPVFIRRSLESDFPIFSNDP